MKTAQGFSRETPLLTGFRVEPDNSMLPMYAPPRNMQSDRSEESDR
jgi:hypothetical protein